MMLVLPWRTQIVRVIYVWFGRWELQGGISLHTSAAQKQFTYTTVRPCLWLRTCAQATGDEHTCMLHAEPRGPHWSF